MARTTIENASENTDSSHENHIFQADGVEKVELPGTEFVSDASMTRDGQDLILETPSGEIAVIEGYFSAEPAPLLISADGAALTPELVDSFAKSPLEFAANAHASDESPVGAVEEVNGHATVTRADGTVETITIGTPIYQGDIVETDASGAVNIVFIDETSMAISENARLAIQEYTFDPSTESGTTNFSVLRGLFVFTSGLIGRDDPDDVQINTPVGSIGIRGTIIAGEINPGGESNITVLEGAIVVTNGLGNVTLSQQFETVQLNGFNNAMGDVSIVPANDISSRFSSVSTVAPTLFTTINDAAGDQKPAPQNNAPSEEPQSQNTDPAPEPVPQDIVTLNQTSGTTSTLSGSTTTTVQQTYQTTQITSENSAPKPLLHQTSTTTTTTNNTTPFEISFTGTAIKDTAQAGDIIGRVSVSGALASSLSYTFANGQTISSNGYFELTGSVVTLTASGAAALGNSLDVVQLGGFGIKASTPLGRTASLQHEVTVVDANTPVNSTHINTPHTGVTILADDLNNQAGYSISALGDINNDGFDDFIFSNNTTTTGQNHVYMVSGATGQLSSTTTLAGYAPLEVIPSPTLSSSSGETVISGIGDFNGDGVEDYIIGQPNNSMSSASGTGNMAIVNGANAAEFITFNGNAAPGSLIGSSVSGIGDFDNDGYADAVIGAPGVNSANGSAFLIRGGQTWGTNIDSTAGSSDQTTGTTGSYYGSTVEGIGDFNGDGYNDYAVSAPGAAGNNGTISLYYGSQTGLSLGETITGTGGEALGTYLFNLGDVNGDGKTDILAAGSGQTYIYHGTDSGIGAPDVTLSLNYQAYEIVGAGSVGDFNGDGYDDFALSIASDHNLKTYVVFGGRDINGADLSYLKNPENAYEINYNQTNDGNEVKISSVGDLNGDGYDDLAIGLADVNGNAAGDGGVAIVYGRNTGQVSSGNSATADGQSFVGGAANNLFFDGGFSSTSMRGGAGNDIFQINNANFLGIDGGGGIDRVRIASSLDFSDVDFEKMSGIEALDFGASGLTMTLTLENIFNLLKTSDTGSLKINGNYWGSVLNIDADTAAASNASNSNIVDALNEMGSGANVGATEPGYRHFEIGGYDLYIADTANLTVNVV